LEQRFGRIHRIGQLKDLLLQAIRYGDQQEVRDRLSQRIENIFDHDHLRTILERNALAQESMSAERLFSVKEEMEKAEARRLQPYFVRSFFMKAFEAPGGTIHPREAARFEITHVPASIRERDRLITGRNRRELSPVLKRYERVCFTREAVRPLDKPGVPFAAMLHPGHPLMLAVSDMLLEQYSNLLRQGAILVNPVDDGEEAHLLFLLTHKIKVDDIAAMRLVLDNLQIQQAKKELQTAEDVLPRVARECYKWFLCPVQHTPTDPRPTVEAFPLNIGGQSLIGEIKLMSVEKKSVLEQAIIKGAATRDFYGTAYSRYEETFDGFKLGDPNVQLDDTLLLIELETAKKYEAELAAKAAPPVPAGVAEKNDDRDDTDLPDPEKVEPKPPIRPVVIPKSKTFIGTVDVNAATARMRLVEIA